MKYSIWFGPLFRRQFRALKWFALAYLLILAYCALVLGSNFSSIVSNIWREGALVDSYSGSPSVLYALSNPMLSLLACMSVLTVLMALFQQYDANHPRNAHLMASLPPKRGAGLCAQLSLGGGIIVVTALLFGAFGCALFQTNRAILEFGTAISPYPGMLATHNTHLAVIFLVLRLLMLQLSLYLVTTLVAGLFGNPLISAGFLGGVALFLVTLSASGSQIMQHLRTLNAGFVPSSPRATLNALIGYDYFMNGGYWLGSSNVVASPLPWNGFGAFAVFHLALAGVCVTLCALSRRRVRIEELGSVFLFQGSRWLVVIFLTLWPLLPALLQLAAYSKEAERMAYNVWFPLWLIPVALVFGVSWYFLIARPRKRALRAAPVLALLMVMLVALPGGALAEASVSAGLGLSASPDIAMDEEYVQAKLDASRIRYDAEQGRRIDEVTAPVKKAIEQKIAQIGDDDFAEYWYDSNVQTDYAQFEQSGAAIRNYDQYYNLMDSTRDFILYCDLSEIASMESALIEGLENAGLTELADGFKNRESTSALLHQDGFWLGWGTNESREYVNNELVEVRSYTSVQLYADTPFTVVWADRVDAAIKANPNMRRRSVYSNGEYDTLSYERMWERMDWDAPYYGYGWRMHAVFKGGKLDRLMLTLPTGYPYLDDAREEALGTLLGAAVADDLLTEEQAQSALEDMVPLVNRYRSGSGTCGAASWTVERQGLLDPNTLNIYVKAG